MMRQWFPSRSLGLSAALVVLAQPALAATAKITDVELKPVGSGLAIVLKTQGGKQIQVLGSRQGNKWVAEIPNAQLHLPQGNFQQERPIAGIEAVQVASLAEGGVRVTVTGSEKQLAGRIGQRRDDQVSFVIEPQRVAQVQPKAQANPTVAQTEVTDPTPRPGTGLPTTIPPNLPQGPSPVPPVLPRAVAPPVGDIAVGQVNVSPEIIDLGPKGATRIPRLVLRDAPVREVLSLLARAAGVNLVYVPDTLKVTGRETELQEVTGGFRLKTKEEVISEIEVGQTTVSLDIENEAVQNVLNYVLRVARLRANKVGNTLFVGRNLPAEADNVISRTLRLNQATASAIGNFLLGKGAEVVTLGTRQTTEITPLGITTTTTTNAENLSLPPGTAPLVLRGLRVVSDDRTNTVTLTGPPRLVEIASGYIAQLDLRRRQAMVNVKVIDVTLNNTQAQGFSFSFGLGDTFFRFDNGAAVINFGASPIPSASVIPGAPLATPPAPGNFSPFAPELPPGQREIAPIPFAEPFRQFVPFSQRFFAALQAQIVQNNAKILTDPTLLIQEGETATLELTAQVVTNVVVTPGAREGQPPSITVERQPAGLVLSVGVERIDDNGFITLQAIPDLSAPSGSFTLTTPGPVGQGNAINTITLLSRRRVTTGRVRLRDGQPLVLTGVIQDSDRVQASKVPILGDIPILGALFRSTNKTNQRNEVIVVLTPQIINETDAATFNYTPVPTGSGPRSAVPAQPVSQNLPLLDATGGQR